MADITGAGSSFGGAIRNLLGKVSMGAARGSYTRATTAGQFRQLFGSDRGYKALQDAGLDVKQARTMAGWLDGSTHPNKANTSAINRAYEAMAKGGTPEWVRKGRMEISGQAGTGRDIRDRGSGGNAPLRIDMSQASAGGWDRVDAAVAEGGDDDVEEVFAEEVIAEDIGDGSDGWAFPGASYIVSVTS